MSSREKLKLRIAAAAIVVGVLAALLPTQWIEGLFEVSPDGGSGSLELLFVVVPIAVGVMIAAHTLLGRRSLSSRQNESPRRR
jgi:putative effector of murein hydrolase LrgA (UPF0299 family)